jgi:hypothetical protein
MKRLTWVGLLALVLVAAAPAGASTFISLNEDELVAQSDAVVEGRVLKVNSFWSPSGRLIVTEAMVQVEEKIRGEAPSVVIVRTAGGTVGGYSIEAHGFPKFAVGERLLLFVQNPSDVAQVTGYRQGQYRIFVDKAGVRFAVPTLGDDVNLINSDGSRAALPKAVRLDEFKARIKSAADRTDRQPLEN